MLPLTYEALHTWLHIAGPPTKASPESHAAAAVRQQLQASQLLQHLGTAMDAAAARLTAAVAALAGASSNSCSNNAGGSSSSGGSSGRGGSNSNSSGSSGRGGSSSSSSGGSGRGGRGGSSSSSSGRGGNSSNSSGCSSTEQVSIQQLTLDVMGENFQSSCLLKIFLLATYLLSPTFSIQAALPAAPAAMCLMLTVFQNYHMQPPLQLFSHSNNPLLELHRFMLSIALGVEGDAAGMLQSCPAAGDLLLSPELLSCLAIMLVVIVLGLDTSTDRTDAYRPSEEQRQAGSRGSGLVSGGRLDSPTPLSCGLFDALGVPKETALQAAMVAQAQGFSTLFNFKVLMASYNSVLDHQVSQVCWA
jgi:hypothetical protein